MSLCARDVKTYVQSGNVVFKTAGRGVAKLAQGKLAEEKLAARITAAIESSFGFDIEVLLRTPAELRGVIAANPFAGREDIAPNKLLVDFLAREPDAAAREKLLALDIAPEELRIQGREIYVYFANGMARPKLPSGLIDRTVKMPCTGRNWNTVTKLLEMAEAMGATIV